jgi:hypothetical protein
MKTATIQVSAGTVAVLAAIPVQAASWYPPNCHFVDYCAAVDRVTWSLPENAAAPRLIFASLHGEAAVQRNFTVHESKDGRVHVCMRYDAFGDLEVTCLLVPNRGF